MVALEKKSIPFSVIPGVTAAFAASAAMCMEYTLPEITQTLILTRMEGRTPVPEAEALEKLASHQASMAVYLSITLVDKVEAVLKKAYGEHSLCAVAFRVSQPEEKIIYTELRNLACVVRENNITHQALIIVSKNFDEVKKGIKYKSKLYDKSFTHDYRTGV
jgi:precorrin-4/cobalt-precorrin-4 C11-methyltransferase